MQITTTDSNGKQGSVDFAEKDILIRAKRRGYGWTIKPDTRAKHPGTVKPKRETVIELAEVPQAGQVMVVSYTYEFGAL